MDKIDTPKVLSPVAVLRCGWHDETKDRWVYTMPPPADPEALERLAKQEADRQRAVAILGDRNIVHEANRVGHIHRRELKVVPRYIPHFLRVIK